MIPSKRRRPFWRRALVQQGCSLPVVTEGHGWKGYASLGCLLHPSVTKISRNMSVRVLAVENKKETVKSSTQYRLQLVLSRWTLPCLLMFPNWPLLELLSSQKHKSSEILMCPAQSELVFFCTRQSQEEAVHLLLSWQQELQVSKAVDCRPGVHGWGSVHDTAVSEAVVVNEGLW